MSIMAPGKKAFLFSVKLTGEVLVYADTAEEAIDHADHQHVLTWDAEITGTEPNESAEPEDKP